MSFGLYIGEALKGYDDAENQRFKRRSQRRREFLNALQMMPESSSASDLVNLHKDTFGKGWMADNSGFDNSMLEDMAKERNRRFELQKLQDTANQAQAETTLRENTLKRARDAAVDGPETLRNFLKETVPRMDEAGVDTGLGDWENNFDDTYDRLQSQWVTNNLQNYIGRPIEDVKRERPDIFGNEAIVTRLKRKNTAAFSQWMNEEVKRSPHLFYDPDSGGADTQALRQRAEAMGADWSQISKDQMDRLEMAAKQTYDTNKLKRDYTKAQTDVLRDKSEENTPAGQLKRYKTNRNEIIQDYADDRYKASVSASEEAYRTLKQSEPMQRGDSKRALDRLATEGVYMSSETRSRVMDVFRLYQEGDLEMADPRTGRTTEVDEPADLVRFIKNDIAQREGRVLHHDNAAQALARQRYDREMKALQLKTRFGDNNEMASNYQRLRAPSQGLPLDDKKENYAGMAAHIKAGGSLSDLTIKGAVDKETGEPATMANPKHREEALYDMRQQRFLLQDKIEEHEANIKNGGPGILDDETLQMARATVNNIEDAIALIEKNATSMPDKSSATSGAVANEPAPGDGPDPSIKLKQPENTETPEYRSAVDEGIVAVKRADKLQGDINAAATAVARKFVPPNQVDVFKQQLKRRLGATGNEALAGSITTQEERASRTQYGPGSESANRPNAAKRLGDVFNRPSEPQPWGPQADPGQRERPFSDAAPRGIRNNNPGNIEKGDPWQGLSQDQSADERFAVFDDPVYGIRAILRTLQTYQDKHDINTVRGIINRWAPQHENNTDAYMNHVAGQLGVSPDDPIDVTDPEVSDVLVRSIIKHENGKMPYDDATLRRAQRLANNS